MATKSKHGQSRKVADSYFKLVVECPLISIKTEHQLDAAQAMVDRLLTKGPLDHGEELYLDALSDLVAAYEDTHYALTPASDADMLRHLMDTKDVTQAELHRQTGIPKSTISEILAGKKPFSKAIIRTLATFFDVDTSVLASNL
jgi:HTH-type transcriptional regulator/antitoxin HigA